MMEIQASITADAIERCFSLCRWFCQIENKKFQAQSLFAPNLNFLMDLPSKQVSQPLAWVPKEIMQ